MLERPEAELWSKGAGALEGKLVLVAEDSWYIAAALSTLLEAEGARILGPAASLGAAVRLTGTQRPDLAMVDMNLRGETAWDLLRQLDALKVRTVILSGHALDMEHGPRDAGRYVIARLSKPAEPADIIGALAGLADGRA